MLLLGGTGRLHAQTANVTVNGMSYIWELLYNATNLDPNADTDGDGVINLLESIAGTNPFDSNSVPRITMMSYTPTNFSVTMPAQLGKLYQLQSVTDIYTGTNLNWTNETSMIPRGGSLVTLTTPGTHAPKYFRVAISDVDTDGDGLTDWEEYQLGLDPLNAYSNGQLDQNGVPLTDYAYVMGRLASQNVVTISATDPTATQPDPGQPALATGLYTVTRGGFPLNSITVNLALGRTGNRVCDRGR